MGALSFIFLLIVVIGWAVFYFVFFKSEPSKRNGKSLSVDDYGIKGKRLITEHEKVMFSKLREAVPDCYIFPQVCLGAILSAPFEHRGRFAQKMADFVVTDNNFNILVVIELDDSSHRGKEAKDAERDAMVMAGGHKVLRYSSIQPAAKLRLDILG